jgi:hypothetical protein
MIQPMAIPNITPIAESEKPAKDIWDKLDIVSRAAIAFFIAVVALLIAVAPLIIPRLAEKIGGKVEKIITTQTTGKDYLQIALGILEKKDLPEEMQKNIGLRQWAVGLLKYYSPAALDKITGDKLVSGEVDIPLVDGNSQYNSSQFHDWESILPNSLSVQAPHGRDIIALVNADGILRISPFKGKQFPAYIYRTEIKSPQAPVFSEDGAELLVFNNKTLMLFPFDKAAPEGLPHLNPPKQITPPNGIRDVSFSYERGATIIVTGADGKRTSYDLDGNENKQQ